MKNVLKKEEKMIKSIYDEKNRFYKHEYYCDICFTEISEYGEILRNEKAIKLNKFDLCSTCFYLLKKEGEF